MGTNTIAGAVSLSLGTNTVDGHQFLFSTEIGEHWLVLVRLAS